MHKNFLYQPWSLIKSSVREDAKIWEYQDRRGGSGGGDLVCLQANICCNSSSLCKAKWIGEFSVDITSLDITIVLDLSIFCHFVIFHLDAGNKNPVACAKQCLVEGKSNCNAFTFEDGVCTLGNVQSKLQPGRCFKNLKRYLHFRIYPFCNILKMLSKLRYLETFYYCLLVESRIFLWFF